MTTGHSPDARAPLERLRAAAGERSAAGLQRRLRPRAADSTTLDLASNDYLGLARDLRVTGAAATAALQWGAGSTGSRLVTGSTSLHADLEDDLAGFVGAGAGLVFSSGYLANLAAVTALAPAGGLVVSDARNHASLIDACRLSRAEVLVVPHRDVGAVEAALAARRADSAVVVTDAVFSVDGDLAPLAGLHAVAREHGALLVIDEAHSLGVIGNDGTGLASAAGLAGAPDVVITATLSKSLGAQGGAVLADPVVIEHLVNTARPFIFDTGLAPAAAAAALSALQVLRAEPQRANAVRRRALDLAGVAADAGWASVHPEAGVVSLPMRSADAAVEAMQQLDRQGVRVGCFRPPSVPDGTSRLRLTAHCTLTDADIDRLRATLPAAAGQRSNVRMVRSATDSVARS